MSIYSVSERQLTRNTKVYVAVNDETGEFVANSSKEKAIVNLCAYMNRNNILNLDDWEKQPGNVRKQFIFAFNQCKPSIPAK